MKTILLAEDNDNLRELITDFLSEHEFEVDAVEDGEEAWEIVLTKSYQLILLDAGNGRFYALQKNPGTGIGASAFPDCTCAGGRSAAGI